MCVVNLYTVCNASVITVYDCIYSPSKVDTATDTTAGSTAESTTAGDGAAASDDTTATTAEQPAAADTDSSTVATADAAAADAAPLATTSAAEPAAATAATAVVFSEVPRQLFLTRERILVLAPPDSSADNSSVCTVKSNHHLTELAKVSSVQPYALIATILCT
jgi:hypothetical protein